MYIVLNKRNLYNHMCIKTSSGRYIYKPNYTHTHYIAPIYKLSRSYLLSTLSAAISCSRFLLLVLLLFLLLSSVIFEERPRFELDLLVRIVLIEVMITLYIYLAYSKDLTKMKTYFKLTT